MSALLPGATIGVLGGGQLARMLALEARRMGYRVGVLDPDPHGSAAQVADFCVAGALDDLKPAKELASRSDVVTLDTEHVPAELLKQLEESTLVRPGSRVLGIIQDRAQQRSFLEQHAIPQPAFAPVTDDASLERAAVHVGFPGVLKTTHAGYDGKGQVRVDSLESLRQGWERLNRASAILERFVDFQLEASVLLARDLDGVTSFYPLAENAHVHHVLRCSIVPARVGQETAENAQRLAARIASALGHVGVMAVEFFVTHQGGLLVNEIAPRTHNSGHYTFGACVTSQFEQHLRAICGLPLGPPTLLRSAAMINLLGDLWSDGSPDWRRLMAEHPGVKLHLYGKEPAREGRKMGHLLVLGELEANVAREAEQIHDGLYAGR